MNERPEFLPIEFDDVTMFPCQGDCDQVWQPKENFPKGSGKYGIRKLCKKCYNSNRRFEYSENKEDSPVNHDRDDILLRMGYGKRYKTERNDLKAFDDIVKRIAINYAEGDFKQLVNDLSWKVADTCSAPSAIKDVEIIARREAERLKKQRYRQRNSDRIENVPMYSGGKINIEKAGDKRRYSKKSKYVKNAEKLYFEYIKKFPETIRGKQIIQRRKRDEYYR